MNLSRSTFVCIADRRVNRHGGDCPQCREPMRCMGKRWRAPRRGNDRAWTQIAAGRVFWEPVIEHGRPFRLVLGRPLRGERRLSTKERASK